VKGVFAKKFSGAGEDSAGGACVRLTLRPPDRGSPRNPAARRCGRKHDGGIREELAAGMIEHLGIKMPWTDLDIFASACRPASVIHTRTTSRPSCRSRTRAHAGSPCCNRDGSRQAIRGRGGGQDWGRGSGMAKYPRNATRGLNTVQQTTPPALREQASARCSNVDEAVFSFGIIYRSSAGAHLMAGAVMSRNQPVLVAPILGLSIPVPTYLGLSFTQPEAIGRINRYCGSKNKLCGHC
jgi:hypothetical protein